LAIKTALINGIDDRNETGRNEDNKFSLKSNEKQFFFLVLPMDATKVQVTLFLDGLCTIAAKNIVPSCLEVTPVFQINNTHVW
jgi:hypothetical protein